MNDDIIINGKTYPMWQGLVHQKDHFIGGVIVEAGDRFTDAMTTRIKDIRLFDRGGDACFAVDGEDWDMKVNVNYAGVRTDGHGELMIVMTYMGGSSWTLYPKEKP